MGNSRIIVNTQEQALVSTATPLALEVGIVLESPKGPVGVPVKITSETDLLTTFGSPTSLYPVYNAVQSFIKMYSAITISRIKYSDAVPSTATIVSTDETPVNLITLTGKSYSDYENGFKAILEVVSSAYFTFKVLDENDSILESFVVPSDVNGLVSEINYLSSLVNASKIDDGTISSGTYAFASGDTGSLFSYSEVVDAINAFDTSLISKLSILAAPGLMTDIVTEGELTTNPALDAALAIATSRYETLVLADFTPDADVADVLTDAAFCPSSTNIAYYHPGVKMRLTSGELVIPASMAALFVHAAAANISPWTSPAGFTTAMSVPYVSNYVKLLTSSEADQLYEPTGSAPSINPIIYDSELGFIIDGNRTGGGSLEIQRAISVSKLVKDVRYQAYSISKKYQYKPNNEVTWDAWKLEMTTYLNKVVALSGISTFTVLMGKTTMTNEQITNGILIGAISIVPVFTVETIYITINITAE
jgi:hypothetical protein